MVAFLKNRGITITYKRVGSQQMIDECIVGLDFCWPSNQNAGSVIRANLPPSIKSQNISNTPIVLYPWAPVADALVAQGIAQKSGDTYYVVNFPGLIQMTVDGTQWSDIGLPQIYGRVGVHTTDPDLSTTGNSYVGLSANTFNGGNVVDAASVAAVLPQMQALFKGSPLLAPNTTRLWQNFLTMGMGAFPIIAAIESNLIEYIVSSPNPATQQYVRDNVLTLYPQPTVYTTQPFIALTPGGERLMNALRELETQKFGWEQYGFRSAVPGAPNDPSIFGLPGVPSSILSVIEMPKPEIMDRILESLDTVQPTPAASPTAAFKREELYI